MDRSVTSRRAMLATIAGATLSTRLSAANSSFRALVCVRLAQAIDADAILAPLGTPFTIQSRMSGFSYPLNPSLANVERLFVGGSAAILDEDGAVTDQLAYVQGGFAGPSWMLNAADVAPNGTSTRAYPFSSGLLTLLASPVEGSALDNPTLTRAAADARYSFPNTAIGRQLRQIASLLTNGYSQLQCVVSLGGPASVGDPLQQSLARLSQLDQAIGAFSAAVSALGLNREVILFTSTDGRNAGAQHARLVIGGPVAGGNVFSISYRERPGVPLAEWAGFNTQTILPGAVRPAARFLL